MKKLILYNIALLLLILILSFLKKDAPENVEVEVKFSKLNEYVLLGNMKRSYSEGKL